MDFMVSALESILTIFTSKLCSRGSSYPSYLLIKARGIDTKHESNPDLLVRITITRQDNTEAATGWKEGLRLLFKFTAS